MIEDLDDVRAAKLCCGGRLAAEPLARASFFASQDRSA